MTIFYSVSSDTLKRFFFESKDAGALHNEEYAQYITKLIAHDYYYKKLGRSNKWPLMFYLYESEDSIAPLFVFYVEVKKYTKFTVSRLHDKEFSTEV